MTTLLLCLVFALESPSASLSARLRFDASSWVKTNIDALVKTAHAAYEDDSAIAAYNRLLRSIARTIRRRKLSDDASFAISYREFLEYVQAASLDQLPGHKLGFTVPDKQYFEETREYVQIPEFLTDPGFLRSVSRYETIDRAKSFLRKLNAARAPSEQLLFFSYKSQHLGTPDNDDSFLRLLIIVPGNANNASPEKWVQFGVTDPKARRRIRNISVVSAVIAGDGTFNTYFKDYFRTYRRDGSIDIKGRWELGYGDDNCVRCHKSGILPIFPGEGSVSPNEEQAVAEANTRFRSYGSPRFDRYLDQSKFGPGLGSAGAEALDYHFGVGFSKTAVGSSMSCAICHRQDRLAALNWPMDSVVIGSYVTGGKMPLGRELTVSQREELHEKLIAEYFAIDDANPGTLKSWLLGKLR
ncbi:MAG: hypothetical protein WAV47_14450 [Blastocatellia bacterium]